MSCACNQTKRVDTRVRLFQKKKRPPGICSQKSHAWMNKRPVFIHVFVHDKREVWFEIARHGQDSSDDRHGDPNCSTHTSRMRPDSPKLRHASTGNPHETPHDWTIPTQVESDVYPKSACYVSSILESVCSYEGTQSELPYWEIIRYSRTAIKSMILDPVVHSYYGIPQRVMRVKQWCPLCTAPIVCSSLLQCVAVCCNSPSTKFVAYRGFGGRLHTVLKLWAIVSFFCEFSLFLSVIRGVVRDLRRGCCVVIVLELSQ